MHGRCWLCGYGWEGTAGCGLLAAAVLMCMPYGGSQHSVGLTQPRWPPGVLLVLVWACCTHAHTSRACMVIFCNSVCLLQV
jgi:hypothetical protein